MIFRKMLFPLCRKYVKLFLSMIITASLGIGLILGLMGAKANLVRRMNSYLEDYGYSSAVIETVKNRQSLSALDDIESLEEYTVRSYVDYSFLWNENTLNTRMFTFSEDSFLKFYIRESLDEDGIYVDWTFARDNNISLGDILEMHNYNLKYEYKVVGIVSNWESISVKQNRFIVGESKSFGYMYIPDKMVNERGYGYYSQILLKTKNGYTNQEMLDEVLDVLPTKVKVIESYVFEDSVAGKSIELNFGALEGMIDIAPPIFFCITLLIVFLFMVQILGQERRNIGIFKALGYKNLEILPVFLGLACVIAILASAIGIGLSLIVVRVIIPIYVNNFSLPPNTYVLPWNVFCIISLVCLVTCILGTLFSLLPVFKIEPTEALAMQGSSIRNPKLIQVLRLPMSIKLTLSSFIRNWKRILLSSICIASAIAIMIVAGYSYACGVYVKDQTFKTRFQYDVMCYYTGSVSTKKYNQAESVDEYTVINIVFPEIEFEGKKESITIFAMDNTDFLHLVDETGKKEMDLPETGLVLSAKAAKRLGASVGDTVLMNDQEIMVAGISRQYICSLCYMNRNDLSNYTLNSVEAALCRINDRDAYINFASKTSGYASMEFISNLSVYIDECFDNIYLISYVLLVFAFLMGFIVIYNISQINLKESQKEIAIMKTIGVRQSYISLSWLSDSMLQFMIALCVGIPIGNVIAKFSLAKMESREWEYPYFTTMPVYGVMLLCSMAFILLSHMASMLSIRRWNLADLTRSKE